MNAADYSLLTQFRGLFEGRRYNHRNPAQGDQVLRYFYEDLRRLNRSPLLTGRVDAKTRVLNTSNKRVGIISRRGDGAFGDLVPVAIAVTAEGFAVARGPLSSMKSVSRGKFWLSP